jgi:catechol 2,3-dioxygenase-like lactoylglutathione lyase family enzyme
MIAARRISHATYETPDLARQVDYYTQVIGLALAAREADRAILATRLGMENCFSFLRCGPDHHTVNFRSGDKNFMHHIAFGGCE